MSNERIARILDAHGILNYEQDGHIYADTMEAFDDEGPTAYDDLTRYTRAKLFAWLQKVRKSPGFTKNPGLLSVRRKGLEPPTY